MLREEQSEKVTYELNPQEWKETQRKDTQQMMIPGKEIATVKSLMWENEQVQDTLWRPM